MLKRFAFLTLGVVLSIIGVIGLVVPVLPGVLFLALAALSFSAGSPRVGTYLEGNPTWRRYQRRWRRGAGLGPTERARLAFWLSVDAALPRQLRKDDSYRR